MTTINRGDMSNIFRRYGRMRKITSLFGFEKVWNTSLKKSIYLSK
jgi:hypothetical protein